MPKTKTHKIAKSPLPLLAAAIFCERVIQENDGVLTVVRIIDTVALQKFQLVSPPSPTEIGAQQPPGGLQLLIVLKSGDFIGRGVLSLKAYKPSGQLLTAKTSVEMPIELKGGQSGANLVINLGLPFEENGIYWFEVYFDDKLLTRMPLSVAVSEPTTGISAPSEPEPGARQRKARR